MEKITRLKAFCCITLAAIILWGCKSQKEYMELRTTLPILEKDIRGSVKFPVNDFKSPQLRGNQDKDLALGISLSGGGTRAQAFSFGVLLGLENIKYKESSNLLMEIDYFSSVSGGSFAAGTYFAEFHNNSLSPGLNEIYTKATTSPLNGGQFEEVNYFEKVSSAKWKIGNLKNTFFCSKKGRKRRLEAVMKDVLLGYKGYSDLTFNDIFKTNSNSQVPDKPWWLINTTIYPKFTRIAFLPSLVRDKLAVNYLIDIKGSPSIELKDNLSVAYAIAMSSAFPVFTPTYILSDDNESKKVELMDGGITDNLGITRLVEVMHDKEQSTTNKYYIIVDCAGNGDYTHLYSHDGFFDKVGNTALATVDGRHYDFYDRYLEFEIPDLTMRTVFNIGMLLRDISQNDLNDFWKNDATAQNIKEKIESGEYITEKFHEDYLLPSIRDTDKIIIHQDTDSKERLDLIVYDELEKLSIKSRILLFEMVSNIDTKLLIKPVEKQALILAGKYVVYLERSNLKLSENKVPKEVTK